MVLSLSTIRGRVWDNLSSRNNIEGIILEGFASKIVHISYWEKSREILILGDTSGCVFLLLFKPNRFSLVQKFSKPVAGLALIDNILIIAAERGGLHVLDIVTNQLVLNTENIHNYPIISLVRLGSSSLVASVSKEVAVVWDISQNFKIVKKIFPKQSFWSAATAGEKFLLLGDYHGAISIWNDELNKTITGNFSSNVSSISSLGSEIIANTFENSRTVRISENGKIKLLQCPRITSKVSLMIMKRTTVLISLLENGSLMIADLVKSIILAIFARSDKIITDFSCGGEEICASFSDGSFELIDLNFIIKKAKIQAKQNLIFLGETQEVSLLEELAPEGSRVCLVRKHKISPIVRKQFVTSSMEEKYASVLTEQGSFPSKQRGLIWMTLLEIPKNMKAFEILSKKGIHRNVENYMLENTNLHSHRGFQRLLKLVSLIVHWDDSLEKVSDFIPRICFPFLEVLGHDLLGCFEVTVSVLGNFFARFFDFHPYPPLDLIAGLVETLHKEDAEIAYFLANLAVGTDDGIGTLLWGAVKSNMTDMLIRDDWLIFMDFCIVNKKKDIHIRAVICWLKEHKRSLLNLKNLSQVKTFLKTPRPSNMKDMMKAMEQLIVVKPEMNLFEPSGFEKNDNYVPLLKDVDIYPKIFKMPEIVENSKVSFVKPVNDFVINSELSDPIQAASLRSALKNANIKTPEIFIQSPKNDKDELRCSHESIKDSLKNIRVRETNIQKKFIDILN